MRLSSTRSRCAVWVPVLVSALGFAAKGAGDQATLPAPNQLILKEQFSVEGDEPYFWAIGTFSDLWHGVDERGNVTFDMLLTRFDGIMGAQEPIQARLTEGVEHLILRRDQANRRVTLRGELAMAGYLNGFLDQLGELPHAGAASWEQRVRLFDRSVVPGLRRTEAVVRVEVEHVAIGREVGYLLTYESEPAKFEAAGAVIEARYRGFALIDEARALVYHTVFEQSGTAVSRGRRSPFRHVTAAYLADNGDEPIVPVRSVRALKRVADGFDYRGRPQDAQELNPDVEAEQERPAWATETWLAGRIANVSVGALAEQGVNPVALISVGTIVQTDAVIGFAGNMYKDRADIAAGRKDEVDGYDWLDKEYKSPRERVQAVREDDDDRALIFTPGTKAAVKIGGSVIGIGMTTAAASTALQSTSSSIGFATTASTTSYGTVTTASFTTGVAAAGGLSTGAAVGLGAGAAAAVGVGVAVADNQNNDTVEPPPPPPATSLDLRVSVNEALTGNTVGSTPCWAGTVTLVARGGKPGDDVMLSGTGIPLNRAGSWGASDGKVFAGADVSLTIALPEHCDCMDGTISVLLNGQPVVFQFSSNGQTFGTFTGQVTASCF